MTSTPALAGSSLHILLDGRIFEEQPRGGISRIYHETLPRMCMWNDEIGFSILTSGALMQPLPEHPRIQSYNSNVSIHRVLRPQTLFWWFQDELRARLQLRAVPYGQNTIWHATYFQLPSWWRGPKITTVYDLIPETFPHYFNKNYDEIFRRRKRRAVLAADHVICISESVRSEVMERYGLPAGRVTSIPLACGDAFRVLRKEEIPPDFRVERPFFLYVGMREHYKNFSTLLEAYAAWPSSKEVALLVVGAPWSEDEQRRLRAKGLELNVVLRSDVSDEELCALYNQALAFVYPSFAEGFGIPILEAMACGCPVVASRIPTFMEVARDIPYFFDPLDKDQLLAALDAACSSTQDQAEREDILSQYSWDRNAHATLQLYQKVAGCAR